MRFGGASPGGASPQLAYFSLGDWPSAIVRITSAR